MSKPKKKKKVTYEVAMSIGEVVYLMDRIIKDESQLKLIRDIFSTAKDSFKKRIEEEYDVKSPPN